MKIYNVRRKSDKKYYWSVGFGCETRWYDKPDILNHYGRFEEASRSIYYLERSLDMKGELEVAEINIVLSESKGLEPVFTDMIKEEHESHRRRQRMWDKWHELPWWKKMFNTPSALLGELYEQN
jgi:hypothetical protein